MAMRFAVEWSVDALNQLAQLWIKAPDRGSVTSASHHLDTELRRDPFNLGESRDSFVNRTAIAMPLGIEFEIIKDDIKSELYAFGRLIDSNWRTTMTQVLADSKLTKKLTQMDGPVHFIGFAY